MYALSPSPRGSGAEATLVTASWISRDGTPNLAPPPSNEVPGDGRADTPPSDGAMVTSDATPKAPELGAANEDKYDPEYALTYIQFSLAYANE